MPPETDHASGHAAIVLAAGQSRRFGAQNKLLAPIDGVPMLEQVLDAVSEGGAGQCILVTGQPDHRIDALAASYAAEIVRNPDYVAGMGSSIAKAIAHIAPAMKGTFIVLGDMPLIQPALFNDLARLLTTKKTIARPITSHGPGHPVLFSCIHFPRLAALTGDEGATAILATHNDAIATIKSTDMGCMRDFDTPQAIEAYRNEQAANDRLRSL